MPVLKFDDFVRLANFFYKTIGIRPYDEPGRLDNQRTLVDNIVFYSGLINMNLVLLGETLYVGAAFIKGENFIEAIMTLSYMGFVLVGEFKMMTVWWKKHELTEFIARLQRIFPNKLEQQELLETKRYLKLCTIVTVSFSLLYMLLIWTYNLFAILTWLIYEVWLKVREVGQTLPYFMLIPWDWHDNWTYYLLYASGDFAGYTSAAGQISSDLLLCAVATQVIMHYEHVARSIENYNLKANQIMPTTKINERNKYYEEDLEYISSIIAYHENILSISDKMNDVFGVPLLFNFMTSSFVICFVGFQMTIGDTTTDTQIKLFLFLFSSTAQVYLICHYGQLLIDASTSIARAVYNHQWSNADIRYKKMLVLISERAQKPALLKATTFVSVSRNTMTDLMQMSYKFFALLRTMYSK